MPRKKTPVQHAFTYDELESRIKGSATSSHHLLPRSRGGGGDQEIKINKLHHQRWHTLFANRIAREVAMQLNLWWQEGHIFKDYSTFQCRCDKITRNTRDAFSEELGSANPRMNTKKRNAWFHLFGNDTDPETVMAVINSFFIHPKTPIELVHSCKSRKNRRSR